MSVAPASRSAVAHGGGIVRGCFVPVACALWLLSAGGCSQARRFGLPVVEDAGVVRDGSVDATPEGPDAAEPQPSLLITHLVPASGPFTGGTSVVVRGAGFTEQARVSFAGRLAQPADYELIDTHRLRVLAPPGDVGPADVVIEQGDATATLEDAYVYNALVVTPAVGSVAGGTRVEIVGSGTAFDEGVAVRFGDQSCVDVKVVSPTRITCRTPAHPVGSVDVTVESSGELTVPIVAADGFAYEQNADTYRGGLSGPPIDGTINVTVIDAFGGVVVRGAFAIVGSDLETSYQGLTNSGGQITFSGDDLVGPLTVHVSKHCYESGSIVAFDARDVTIFLRPLLDPSCGDPGQGGGGGVGRFGAFISGELMFRGAAEFGTATWDDVPMPREDEYRVTYVYTTRAGIDQSNPSPGSGGATWRVTETEAVVGVRGFSYRIFARPAALAVYALAGVENRRTQQFTPYMMGVTRGVVAAPGAEVTGVDIDMTIPLDRELQVLLSRMPAGTPQGPNEYRVTAHLDLGGEGYIVRQVNGRLFDSLRRVTSGTVFRFLAQPALVGALADARYLVNAGWYAGAGDSAPHTAMRVDGVTQHDEPLALDTFLGIPQSPVPPMGGGLPADRVLRWSADGATPDVHIVTLTSETGGPLWRQVVPGNVREVSVPDLSSIDGLGDLPSGTLLWNVRAARLPDFDFNSFSYTQLSSRFWTADALHTFTMQR